MQRGRAAGESVTELGERRRGRGQRSGACAWTWGGQNTDNGGATACVNTESSVPHTNVARRTTGRCNAKTTIASFSSISQVCVCTVLLQE